MGMLKCPVIDGIRLGVLFSGLKGIHQQPNPSMGSLVMKEQLVLQFSSSHNVIGRGAFGHVYKGVFPNGVDVAVKTARGEYTSTRSEFENEVRIIPKLQHANIIKLLGCCFEGGNRALVYEYMPNGSLDNRICELSAGVLLAWPTRFRIIEGIAQGALYLHQHSRLRVIHGDLKPSNILLDYDMTPRIIDFGMAQVLSSDEDEKEVDTVAGTLGYIDPNFFCTKIISIKSDVYAFGVTTLVIITARRTFRHSSPEMQPLVTDAWELWSSERAIELVDPSLCNEPRIDDILRCIQIALLCVQENSADRPTMSDVLIMLNCECMTLPVPRPPARRVRQGAGESLADASETAGITHHTENEVQATIDNAIVVA